MLVFSQNYQMFNRFLFNKHTKLLDEVHTVGRNAASLMTLLIENAEISFAYQNIAMNA